MSIPRKSEFERLVNLNKLPLHEMKMEITASPQECAALAKRFGIADMKRLDARLKLRRYMAAGGPEISITGDFSADVTLTCVITSEPIESCVASSLAVRYMSPQAFEELESWREQQATLPAEEDDIEPLEEGELDVGELVAQYVSVSIDPYPRKAGAGASDSDGEADDDDGRLSLIAERSPFSILKKLYDKG